MKSLLDKGFKYRPSHDTDIRKTFERIRRQRQEQKPEAEVKIEKLPARKRA